MTLGRPPMVAWPTTIPMPVGVDDEQLKMNTGSYRDGMVGVAGNEGNMSKIEFFVQTLKLTDVMMSVLKNLYRPPEEVITGATAAFNMQTVSLIKILELDADMARWRKAVPPHLAFTSSSSLEPTLSHSSEPIFLRQATSLHCRYLHLRILLFRPMLVHLSSPPSFSPGHKIEAATADTDFQQDTQAGCVRACVAAAIELVTKLENPAQAWAGPPWWYSIFYLYTAGTVLLSALISPSLRSLLLHRGALLRPLMQDQSHGAEVMSGLETSLAECIASLGRYASRNIPFARRCHCILQAVDARRWEQQQASPIKDRSPGASTTTQWRDCGHRDKGEDLEANTRMPPKSGDGGAYHLPNFEQTLMAGDSDLSDLWWPGVSQLWSGDVLSGDQGPDVMGGPY
ncbi:uncharacterized protein B0I36DRAFT_331330 [Microdochium trichocladiopsis]|uniref:Transcription factor domain-containing protein n=1 Tax=Microdochium trichocladiopsis TaxID=1682393 RepID=A0A9P8XXG3_9PEZI|nr:uncharacterized protein B0I36DRAFT_331330 [Microdochium trichocladiopsis]KAH7024380.1 hypothetical protein B0I36DRAFT_331330 [Microdochium trichocladiopsis]